MTLVSDQTKTEEDYLIKAAKEDSKEFGTLYNLYVGRIFKYLYSRLGTVEEAEDVTSQTFLTAFEAFERYRQDGHFSSWLFTIARNKAMDHYRQKKKSFPADITTEVSGSHELLKDVIQSEQSMALGKLIMALPNGERELLRLRFLAEMSYPEIAHLVHRNTDAVKKSIHRLLARLHSRLEASNE